MNRRANHAGRQCGCRDHWRREIDCIGFVLRRPSATGSGLICAHFGSTQLQRALETSGANDTFGIRMLASAGLPFLFPRYARRAARTVPAQLRRFSPDVRSATKSWEEPVRQHVVFARRPSRIGSLGCERLLGPRNLGYGCDDRPFGYGRIWPGFDFAAHPRATTTIRRHCPRGDSRARLRLLRAARGCAAKSKPGQFVRNRKADRHTRNQGFAAQGDVRNRANRFDSGRRANAGACCRTGSSRRLCRRSTSGGRTAGAAAGTVLAARLA